jgi:GNAT superfamily N-acetyltransferase
MPALTKEQIDAWSKRNKGAFEGLLNVNQFVPVSGDIQSGIMAGQDLAQGNYGSAALNAVGLLPFIPALGGTVAKAPYFKESMLEGFGKVISSPHGEISILSNNPYSPRTHSVTKFFVDETKRNKGYGKELIDEALKQYPSDIGAQVSSPASAKVFYNKGFRLASDPKANIDEIFKNIEDYSSAYMVK